MLLPMLNAMAALLLSLMLNMLSTGSMHRKIGCDIENLLISQPDNGEQALEITEYDSFRCY